MNTRSLFTALKGLKRRYARRRRSVSSTQVENMCLEALEGRMLYSAVSPVAELGATSAMMADFVPEIEGERGSNDQFGRVLAVGDFDGNGLQDLAIGIPNETADIEGVPRQGGAVQVIYSVGDGLSFRDQLWSQATHGVEGKAEAGDHFGSALAVGDFNGDEIDDLAIGVPHEDFEGTVKDKTDVGVVNVIYGAQDIGLSVTATLPDQLFHQNKPGIAGAAESGDLFGSALTTGDFNGDGIDDLAVGVWGEDIGTLVDAGAVNVIYGSDLGLHASENHVDQIWHQDSPGIQGRAERGDRFGWSLAAGDFNEDQRDDLAIGVPREDIFFSSSNNVVDAGAVNVIYGSGDGLHASLAQNDQIWTQESLGETSERGDQFGYSLATGNFDLDAIFSQGPSGPILTFHQPDDLVISTPYEDLDLNGDDVEERTNAGMVHVMYGSVLSNALTTNGSQTFHQGHLVGTSPESGDRFGLSLTTGNFDGQAHDDLAIGSPHEGFGPPLAGVVHVIYSDSDGLDTAGNQMWHENSVGIPDQIEAGDEFGFALAAGDFTGDGIADLAVGVTFEDHTELPGNTPDAGAVQVITGANGGLSGSGGRWYQGATIGLAPLTLAELEELDESL